MLTLHAVGALHDELVLDPKPGLVTPHDRGSHDDMDGGTFVRSLFSLRRYFAEIAAAGRRHAAFDELQALGIAAEARMLRATGGVNTHRGAIFSLGLLCAAAAGSPQAIRDALLRHWGDALRARSTDSRGAMLARQHHLRSANTEAALGMPTLFDHAWPAYLAARRDRLSVERCRLQALFASIAALDDTNLVHRGGLDGLRFAQASARRFLDAGGAGRPDAIDHARRIGADFVARRLSPGGSADVLAGVCFLARLAG